MFDAADLTAESSSWVGLLGGTIDAEGGFQVVFVDGALRVGVQLALNHVAPEWQIRLDLWVMTSRPLMDLMLRCRPG